MSLLSIDNATKTFRRGKGPIVHAVNGISLDIAEGETYGLIGESGSGKSTVGRLALGLLEADEGTIRFEGKLLSGLRREERRKLRSRMTVVFQEPYEALNPRMTVGSIVAEPVAIQGLEDSRRAVRARVVRALESVQLEPSLAGRHPRDLSGGQQQRVGIARAIITQPRFIVLDEPTSSLDVSVQAQILILLAELQAEYGLAYLFISHDIHTVEWISDRISIMYLGQIFETGPRERLFEDPQHPYTRALLSARLSSDPNVEIPRFLLGREIPSPTRLPPGCFLSGRCPIEIDECSQAPVPLEPVGADHEVACIRAGAASGHGPETPLS